MKTRNPLVAAALLEHRHTAWGLRPDTLAMIVALGNGDMSVENVQEHARPQAARGAAVATGGVALIPLRGLITPRPSFLSLLFGGGGGLMSFRGALREAVGDQDITAIIIDVDSPGGSTDLVAETAAEIRAARGTKPIVAVANTWAASAAYWLASQADELVVTPSGEVGSIGVFMAHEDISGLEDQIGIKTTLISAGKYKTEGNPYEPLSDEAREALQAKVDDYYGLFVADVAKGRNVAASAVRGGYGEGRMVTAMQAVELGMADRVDTLEATVARVVRNPRRAGRRAEADPEKLSPKSEGNPEPNPPVEGGEEATARPSQPYIDLMFGATR